MKKRIVSMVLVAAMALGLAACGGSNAPSQGSAPAEGSATSSETDVLYVNLASEPNYVDPALSTTVDGGTLISNTFVGLYTYDPELNLVPALSDGEAEVSEDGLTYTFHLIESKWSDGSELTANDFVYSWNRVADDNTGSDYQYMFDVVARNDDGTLKVEAPDDYTLVVELNAPCPYFLQLCAFPVYMPVPQASVEAADPEGTNPSAWCQEAGYITNGAYTMTSWAHNESMVFEKNENFYNADQVKINKINFMLSADQTAIYAAYNSGDVDFIDIIPNDELPNLLDNPEFHLAKQLCTYFVCFNVNSELFAGKTPEQAAKMRKAISLLVDRTYLIENITLNADCTAYTFVCPEMEDGNGQEFRANATKYYDSDATGAGMVQEAMALLEECGYSFTEVDGGYQISPALGFSYIINDDSQHEKVAQAIQQDLAVVGIEVQIEKEDWNVFVDDRKNGNFDVARHGWVADYSDPINMLEMWTTDSGNNDAQLGRPKDGVTWAPEWSEYDALISQARVETDTAKRADLLHQAEDMLMDTGAIMPLYHYSDTYMQKPNVSGIYASVFALKYFMYAEKN